jgi:hypothetical protein
MKNSTKAIIALSTLFALFVGFTYARAEDPNIFSTIFTINTRLHITKFIDPSTGAICYITTDNAASMNAISCVVLPAQSSAQVQGTRVSPNLVKLN